MGSINKVFSKPFFPAVILLIFVSFSLFAQSAVSLSSEITRLERLSLTASSRERYDANMTLVLLHRLSGNTEAALNACEEALALYPQDGKALLEQCRLLISLGEYEKASSSAIGLLRPDQETEIFLAGRYLGAQAEAFRSGNVQALAALASEPEFSEYLGAIYYTLWRLTDIPSWRSRLASELPQSPEAGIAGGTVLSAATPLWLLFPGRESITLYPVRMGSATPAAQTPASQPLAPLTPPASQTPVSPSVSPSALSPVLQTGLFSSLENAQSLADSLIKAGFTPEIFPRQVNGNNYWAVGVPYGSDMNAMIGRLKEAGFESFPINR